MRLIDADALKEKKVYCPERHEKVVPVAEIDWMPTVEQPHWISVEDRLPDKQPCEYLVVNANNVETAICLDNRWIAPRRVIKITHWMPLPEPPEVEQDDSV